MGISEKPFFNLHLIFIFFFLISSNVTLTAKTKIISSEPCQYHDVSCDFYDYQKWFREEISYSKAIEDLDTLVYLLTSSYAGYDDAVKRGLRAETLIDSFKKSNDKNKSVNVIELSQFIYDFFKPYVQDSHFCIESKDFFAQLVTGYRVLYSNIYVKKTDDVFVIEKSDKENFKCGEIIKCENENIFLYPSAGKDIYRIGTYASYDENEKYIWVICSENKKEILCNISNNYLYTDNIALYKEIESDDSVYIYIPTLMDLQNDDGRKIIVDSNFEKLHSVSERYAQKKNIILDLRTNTGGNSLHTSKFLSNLYFLEKKCNEKNTLKNLIKADKIMHIDTNIIYLLSPPILQANNYLEKNIYSNDLLFINHFKSQRKILDNRNLKIKYCEDYKKSKAKFNVTNFKGKLIILSGKNSASSSELTITEAKALFNKTNQFFQIGENTMGCYAYGNVWCYQLNNSGIALHLPSFVIENSQKTCPEGYGIMPNYWATNEDILKALVNISGDEELSEKLKDINNNL